VISVDQKGIVMRPGHLREATAKAAAKARHAFRTRLSTGEKSCRKRMATLCWIFHTQQEHERLHPSPHQRIYALQV
jgi:hypothetical protein